MWSHKSAVLMFAVVCLAADMDRTLVNLPGLFCSKCNTSCAIARNPDHLQLPPLKSCILYEDPYDYNINIGTLSISAHLKVLAGSIPFFEDPSTSIQSKTKALLDENLDPTAVKALLRFAYTRKVKINNENAKHILSAAQFLKVENVISICTEFIISQLNTQSVIEILNEESGRTVKRIRDAADNYILNKFADVTNTSEFLGLHSAAFLKILRSNEIRNTNEERIFEAAYKWIADNRTDRSALSYEVLENVRFPLIDNRYLIYNATQRLLSMRNEQVHQMLFEAMEYQSSPDTRLDLQGCKTQPRNGTNKFINLRLGAPNIPIQIYEPEVRRLTYAANAPNKRYFAVLLYNCNLFAIGGRNSSSVDVFNPLTNAWSSIQPMAEIRAMPAAAVSNGMIFVCGGYRNDVLSSTEAYNVYKRSWKQLAPMSQKRFGHRLVASGDLLYAIGGYAGHNLRSMEIYDISRNTWRDGAPMLSDRSYFGAALLLDKLYVCGGFGSGAPFAEVFDQEKQTWTALANMKTAKTYVSLVAFKYKLWATNGEPRKSEVYDPETDSWADVPDVFDLDGKNREVVLMNF